MSENKSILLEAEGIVNGDRNVQYGDAGEAFQVYSDICKTAFGLNISPTDICKVQMAIKLGRNKFRFKSDNLVDLCGYAEILNRLMSNNFIEQYDGSKVNKSALDELGAMSNFEEKINE